MRAATIIASWPAPLDIRCKATSLPMTARASAADSVGCMAMVD
jgi:hypothetical protein